MRIGRLVLFALLLFPAAGCAEEYSFESSTVCGKCHKDIYRNWSKSLHALSFKNPIFQTAYRRVYTESKGAAKTICLKCHAPTTLITGDRDADLPITREGITCDFCHTVTKVDMEKPPGSRFTVKPGGVKRASIKTADSPYHETAYSKDFSSSELCGACHDYKNSAGVHIQSTYTEWSGSSFAKEGKQCQQCHMPRIPGETTNLKDKSAPPPPRTMEEYISHISGKGIPDRSLTHSVQIMKEVVRLNTRSIKRAGKALSVVMGVTNVRAGHTVPTGTPARTLAVELRTLDRTGAVIEMKKRIYRKAIIDDLGFGIELDGDAFMRGKEVAYDNRLKVNGITERRPIQLLFRETKPRHT